MFSVRVEKTRRPTLAGADIRGERQAVPQL